MFGYEDVEPLQLQELLQAEEILLIDVRTPTESARGGIPGARNIPLHLLPLRKQELSDDRLSMIICRKDAKDAKKSTG